VEANISFALEQSGERGLPSTRLLEPLLLEILRLHLSIAPAADHGWLAALTPVLAPALSRLHADPAQELGARSSLPEDIAAAVAANVRPGFVKRGRNAVTATVEAACLEGIKAGS
jgi:hypothetical protein